jgi:hypothetical protein
MKTNRRQGEEMTDAIASPEEQVEVSIYSPAGGYGLTLCVNVNGVTVFRVGGIMWEIEVTRHDRHEESRR